MQLFVIAYASVDHVAYSPGQVLDLPDAQVRLLLAASPGSFATEAPAEPEADVLVEAPAEPEADKMLRGRRR